MTKYYTSLDRVVNRSRDPFFSLADGIY